MKTILASLAFALCATAAHADYVNGYIRKDGTYVQGHQRSNSNGWAGDNYSTRGNTNPYTGKRGTKSGSDQFGIDCGWSSNC